MLVFPLPNLPFSRDSMGGFCLTFVLRSQCTCRRKISRMFVDCCDFSYTFDGDPPKFSLSLHKCSHISSSLHVYMIASLLFWPGFPQLSGMHLVLYLFCFQLFLELSCHYSSSVSNEFNR